MDGIAYRVPISDGSLIDVVLELKKDTKAKHSKVKSQSRDEKYEIINEITLLRRINKS